MDIIFDCPNCTQELAVDASGAGSEIECPSCGETIAIPHASKKSVPLPQTHIPGTVLAGEPVNAIASSAAAKVEMHLKVPVRDKPGEILIKKSQPPLEVVQKGAGKRIRIHTLRRASCVESGHDHFDQRATEFLSEVGESNLINIIPLTYEYFDVGTQKVLTDYGIIVIYRA